MPGTWAPPGSSRQVACWGPMGAGQGWQLGGQHWGGKERAKSWPPSSLPLGPPGGAESQAWGCQVEVRRGDAFRGSDGGDVMRWGAQVSGRGLGLPHSFSIPCAPCALPAFPHPHFSTRPRNSGSPSPWQWKKSVIPAAVGGQFFTSKNSGLFRVFVHFIHTSLRPPHFILLETVAPRFRWRDGSTSRTKYFCLSRFQDHSSEGLSAGWRDPPSPP